MNAPPRTAVPAIFCCEPHPITDAWCTVIGCTGDHAADGDRWTEPARNDPPGAEHMSTEIKTYTEDDADEIAALLVGRRIVEAEEGSFDYPGREWRDKAEGRLALDDGTVLYLTGHEGGCSCGAGDYPLESVAAVDNIITSARVECSPTGDDWDQGDGAYRIFVIADAAEINVAEFVGSDGNGYYGTGFALTVVRPPVTPAEEAST